MRKIFLLFITILLFSYPIYASHTIGGDLTWRFISSYHDKFKILHTQLEIKLTVFYLCPFDETDPDLNKDKEKLVRFHLVGNNDETIILNRVGNGMVDVTELCPGQISTCDANAINTNTVFAIKKSEYTLVKTISGHDNSTFFITCLEEDNM
jgi:hypothetical protein